MLAAILRAHSVWRTAFASHSQALALVLKRLAAVNSAATAASDDLAAYAVEVLREATQQQSEQEAARASERSEQEAARAAERSEHTARVAALEARVAELSFLKEMTEKEKDMLLKELLKASGSAPTQVGAIASQSRCAALRPTVSVDCSLKCLPPCQLTTEPLPAASGAGG